MIIQACNTKANNTTAGKLRRLNWPFVLMKTLTQESQSCISKPQVQGGEG